MRQITRCSLRRRVRAYALTILPALMQLAQTRMRLAPPATLAFTGRRLTFQRRRLTLWACEILFPNCGPLPQIWQICAMTDSVFREFSRRRWPPYEDRKRRSTADQSSSARLDENASPAHPLNY